MAGKFLWFLVGVAAIACIPVAFVSAPAAGPVKKVEIREYQGMKLGSVDDFRDNAIRGVQHVDIAKYRLVVDGLTERKAVFTYDELLGKPHAKRLITLHCVEGWSVAALWEGIPLKELFRLAPPKPGAVTVVFHGVDDYTTSLPLEDVLARDLMIADRINGITLPPAQGYPFILVAEEKWGYKWARWITRIELSGDANYQGYWETGGYNRAGDLRGPMFEEP